MSSINPSCPRWLPALRAEFPILRRVAYFQTGSAAPLGATVRASMVDVLRALGDEALATPTLFKSLGPLIEGARTRLAEFLGVNARALGWTANTTTAIHLVVSIIDWQPGDLVITSSTEHVATRTLIKGLVDRRRVRSAVTSVDDGDEVFLGRLEQSLRSEPRARLLLLSHVSCHDGRRLPVQAATELAHARGVPVLVDGAQAVGQFRIDVRALGCDFYAGSARKWLLGPALGFLYVAERPLEHFFPDFVMAPRDTAAAEPATAAQRVEIGTASLAPRAGLDAALKLLDDVGLEEIERHVARLSARLRAGLQALPGVSILTPLDPERSAGITAFTIPDNDLDRVQRVVAALATHRQIIVKAQREHPAVRASIAAFNNQADVDRLLEALTALLPIL